MKPEDKPILEAIADATGYPYPDLDNRQIEVVHVVTDNEDNPIMAVAAEKLVQLYLYATPDTPTAVKVQALKLLHLSMPKDLRNNGYNSCEAFVPESIARKFGRRLERTFGWRKNWRSWTKTF